MIDEVIKRLISEPIFASKDTGYEDIKKILSGVSLEEFPLVIEELKTGKEIAEREANRGVEYWVDTARSVSSSMEEYCDNEARACSRSEGVRRSELAEKIDRIISDIRSIQEERKLNLENSINN